MEVTLDSIRDIRIYQSKTGYRFSVDALFLFDFVGLKTARAIADLGAGSGIVGILLARKYLHATVTLFEIQPGLASLADRNIRINNLEDRMNVVNADITHRSSLRSFLSAHAGFDLVVANPPFRKWKSGRINIDEERAIARHEIKLNLMGLVEAASCLLKPKGRFCVVHHPSRLAELMDILRRKGIEPKRLRFIHSDRNSEAKIVLIEAVREGRQGVKIESPLYIYDEQRQYTNEMKKLYNP
jgi:tRNA1Val (adenine37-N6)-methyltransferase